MNSRLTDSNRVGCLVIVIQALLTTLAGADELIANCDCDTVSPSYLVTDCDSCQLPSRWDNLRLFAGIDGSKQPQDFGVNANLGGRLHADYSIPLLADPGIGLQLGTAFHASANAVRVAELLGEESDRWQSFSSLGVFQRRDAGAFWGITFDLLVQDSFDRVTLGQFRIRGGLPIGQCDEVGVTARAPLNEQEASYGTTAVVLQPIAQGTVFWRRFWQSGSQTTFWAGIAEGHGEDNAVTGFSPPQDDVFVLGADVLAPLNDYLAIYGETNLMMPADTGTVDAFLGIEFYPGGNAAQARRLPFSPVLPVAGNPSFSVDLSRR